jgi:hypothetical protein
MNDLDSEGHLIHALHNLIDRFAFEFDLPYSMAIGCLEIVKQELILDSFERDED